MSASSELQPRRSSSNSRSSTSATADKALQPKSPTEQPGPRRLGALIAIYCVMVVVWGYNLVPKLVLKLRFEDALIVLRYARNIASGQGFVFNPGEHVLGVTTPLHTLLSVLYVAIGVEQAPELQNLAGFTALVASGLVLMIVSARAGHPWVGLLAALLSLGNFHLNHLYFGMEVHLFVLLVMIVFALEFGSRTTVPRENDPSPAWPRAALTGSLLGLAFLVRYDAALLALVVGIRHWVILRRPPIRLVLSFFVVVMPWLLFAQWTFGSILPTPLTAKDGYVSFGTHLSYVLEHYRKTYEGIFNSFVPGPVPSELAQTLSYWFPLALACGVISVAFKHRRFLLLALYATLHVTIYASIGSDPGFAWHYYILTPVGLLFFVLGCRAIGDWLWWLIATLGRRWSPPSLRPSWSEQTGIGQRSVSAAVYIAVLVPVFLAMLNQSRFRYQLDPHTRQLHEMAHWLKERFDPSTSLLQPSIGVLGYESGLRMVDHAGLVTPGLFFFNDIDCTPMAEVIERHSPDLILLSQWSQDDVVPFGYSLIHTFSMAYEYRLFQRTSGTPTDSPPS